MRSTTCLFSTAAALHRVFIAPIEHSQFHSLRQPLRLSSQHKPACLFPPQRRCVATAAPADKRRSPRDDEIKARSVIVVGDDNSLSPIQTLQSVMSRLDRVRYSLIQVTTDDPPLCKIIDKKKLYETAKAKAKNAKKSAAAPTKSLELNWAIEGNDLEHRLRRLKDFLEKGMKVEIAIAPKRRGKKASVEEADGLLIRLRKAVEEVEGARESKSLEGEVGKDVKFFAEGKVKKEPKVEKVSKKSLEKKKGAAEDGVVGEDS